MRIDEIIQSKEKTSDVPQKWDLEQLKQDQLAAQDKKNAGWSSQGYTVDDPFLYGKRSHMPANLSNDGFYQFIQAVKPIMDSNPYVPRVYSIKLLRDRAGNVRPDYRMEKLVHGQTINKKTIHAMGLRAFGDDNWWRTIGANMHYEDLDNIDLWRKLVKLVEFSIHSYPKQFPTTSIELNLDPLLMEVIKIVKMAIIRNNFRLDLHINNVMVRPGPIPQFVISDPLDDE